MDSRRHVRNVQGRGKRAPRTAVPVTARRSELLAAPRSKLNCVPVALTVPALIVVIRDKPLFGVIIVPPEVVNPPVNDPFPVIVPPVAVTRPAYVPEPPPWPPSVPPVKDIAFPTVPLLKTESPVGTVHVPHPVLGTGPFMLTVPVDGTVRV